MLLAIHRWHCLCSELHSQLASRVQKGRAELADRVAYEASLYGDSASNWRLRRDSWSAPVLEYSTPWCLTVRWFGGEFPNEMEAFVKVGLSNEGDIKITCNTGESDWCVSRRNGEQVAAAQARDLAKRVLTMIWRYADPTLP